MCSKCINNLEYIGSFLDIEDVYKCTKCNSYYTEEVLKHELLRGEWEDSWRNLFLNFRQHE